MAEAQSGTTFVMEDRLPWPEAGAAAGLSGPFDAGMIFDAGRARECSIRNISSLGATLRGQVTSAPGDDIAVELATGQRPVGTIEWVRAGEAGIRFRQPVDMLALINRNLVNQPSERRIMPRVELRCGVYIKWCEYLVPAILRNISARGVQLEGHELPPRETYVGLFIEGMNVPPGEVVWRKDNLAGIELLEELSWSSIIPWIRDVGRKAVG